MSAAAATLSHGRYDAQERRRSNRSQRERGCWVYIPAEELQRAGIALDSPAPYYRTTGFQRSANGHTVIVNLYREP